MDDDAKIADLLSHVPTRRLNDRRAGESLTFAFAQGVPETTWEELLQKAALPETTWDPRCFARDLFVAELAAMCGKVVVDGAIYPLDRRWLERLLTHPPQDRANIDFRREILSELLSSETAREEIGRSYALLRKLRAQLAVTVVRHTDVLRRRLDILSSLRAAVDAMAESFGSASSPLTRISTYAASIRDSDAYRALLEVLDYDDNLATVDVRVRVGADGRVRGLALTSVRENSGSRFARTPLARWFARIALLFRGYRFSAEELIAHAIERVFEDLQHVFVALLQLTADLELYLAALTFRESAERAGLEVCLPDIVYDDEPRGRRLEALFNPLLIPQEKSVVPCDIISDREDLLVLVTGPNSGGKTRLLQSIGLTQLLAQCGFLVPAAKARIHACDCMFASFGQAPAADAVEGRLGTELLRVRALFETLDVGGMVLVDELCSGTNPSEGEELFQLVIGLLSELEPQAFLSTHFLTLAAELERQAKNERLSFLQVELDPQQLPTYRFVPGVAKTSLAHRTAARLGVTRDDLTSLVSRAKAKDRRRLRR